MASRLLDHDIATGALLVNLADPIDRGIEVSARLHTLFWEQLLKLCYVYEGFNPA